MEKPDKLLSVEVAESYLGTTAKKVMDRHGSVEAIQYTYKLVNIFITVNSCKKEISVWNSVKLGKSFGIRINKYISIS